MSSRASPSLCLLFDIFVKTRPALAVRPPLRAESEGHRQWAEPVLTLEQSGAAGIGYAGEECKLVPPDEEATDRAVPRERVLGVFLEWEAYNQHSAGSKPVKASPAKTKDRKER